MFLEHTFANRFEGSLAHAHYDRFKQTNSPSLFVSIAFDRNTGDGEYHLEG